MMTDPQHDPATASWHLDKRLNVAVVLALLVHAGASIWWVSAFSSRTDTRLEAAEKRLQAGEDVSRKLADAQVALATQMASHAATMHAIVALQTKIDQRVDNLYRPPNGGR